MKQSQTKENPLGYAPISALIRKFSIPAIVSMLVSAAYNITDQIFIGHVVGMLGNAATNVAFPVVILTTAFALLIGVGTAANFNISMGAEEKENAKQFICVGLTLMSIVGVVIAGIMLLFKTPVLLLCGATENILPYAKAYFGITSFGIPFLLFSNAGSNLIRADGSPSYSMACTVTGAVLIVFLDWLFMFVLNWGIQGAAFATVLGQIVSFVLCVWYFSRFKAFKIQLRMLGVKPKYARDIIKSGIPNFINHSIMMLVNIVMNNTMKHYGSLSIYGSDIPLAVSGVVAKVNNILSGISVGLAQGCQPIFGYNMGAKNYRRVKGTYLTAAKLALCVNVVTFVLFQLFPRQIVSIFGTGDVLYFQFAERYMRIFLMMICVFGVQPLSINYFTSTGNTRQGTILSLSRQGFFLIPLLLLLPRWFGIEGVLYAGPIADALACVLSLTLVYRNFRKLDTKI